MTSGQLNDVFYQMFLIIIQLAGPLLLVAMVVGILVSILQAATQIQEQILTFVPKLLVIGIMLVLMGNSMLMTLQDFLRQILDMIIAG